ncbi:lysylphosphatidylglycerol synthase domain-containing protein [Pseudonocardia nantongensis]|uniref:lysylphosphatidylglycerol synthase domain-containing protein n=1 Tax=Pseudonocardia nantongensis TaxID=1181885 RepID=UPI00397DDE0C
MSAALRVLAAAAVLALLGGGLGTGAVLDALGAVGPGTVLAALGLGLLGTGAMAARWWLVARRIGAPLGTGAAVADLYRAQLLNAVLPAGVLGDVHRAARHAGAGGPAGLRAVVLERVSGQSVVVLTCAALAAAPAAPGPTGVLVAVALVAPVLAWTRPSARAWTRVSGFGERGVPVFAGTRASGVAGAGPPPIPRGPRVLRVSREVWVPREAPPRRPGRGRHVRPAGARCRRAARSWLADVRTVLGSRRTGPAVVALSVAGLGCHLGMFVLAARTAGVGVPLGTLLPLLAAGLLAMSVPIGVGGWGPREGATAGAFAAAGLDPAAGLAAAVVFGALALTSSLPGAVLLCRAPARGRAPDPIQALPTPDRVPATAEGRAA